MGRGAHARSPLDVDVDMCPSREGTNSQLKQSCLKSYRILIQKVKPPQNLSETVKSFGPSRGYRQDNSVLDDEMQGKVRRVDALYPGSPGGRALLAAEPARSG